MSAVLVEADTFDASVTVPADGDLRNAASVTGAFQKLANRTRYMLNHALLNVGGTYTLADNTTIAGAVGKTLTFSLPIVMSGGGILTGGLVIDTAYISGGQLTGVLANVGTGRNRLRRFKGADTGPVTYGITAGDVLDASNLTTGRNWNLGTTGAADGDVIHVTNPTIRLLTLGVGAGSYGLVNTAGNVRGMSFVFSSDLGDWLPLNYGRQP